MTAFLPTVDTIVADLLERWPHTIAVFQKHRMACVGCPFAPFVTLGEAAEIYHLNLSTFLSELQKATSITDIGVRPEKKRKQ